MRTILTAPHLFTGEQMIGPGYVITEDVGIVEVGTGDSPAGQYDLRFNIDDGTLLPGLIDGHVHMAGNGGDDAFQFLRDAPLPLLLARATRNMHVALDSGVTTIRDCGTRNDVAFTIQQAVASGLIPGPDILTSGAVITITGGHGWFFGRQADSPGEIIRAVREQAKLGADHLKVMVTGGLMTGTQPGRLQFNGEELEALRVEASAVGLPIAAHCLTAEGIRAAAKMGVATIEHAMFVTPDGDLVYDPEVAEAILKANIPVSMGHFFGTRALTGESGSSHAEILEVWRTHRPGMIQSYRRLHDLGVSLFVGTDAGWWLTDFSDYYGYLAQMVEEIGLPAEEVLRSATSSAAAALGLGESIGRLEPGYRANVLAVRGNPVEDPYAIQRVQLVMRGGAVFKHVEN